MAQFPGIYCILRSRADMLGVVLFMRFRVTSVAGERCEFILT